MRQMIETKIITELFSLSLMMCIVLRVFPLMYHNCSVLWYIEPPPWIYIFKKTFGLSLPFTDLWENHFLKKIFFSEWTSLKSCQVVGETIQLIFKQDYNQIWGIIRFFNVSNNLFFPQNTWFLLSCIVNFLNFRFMLRTFLLLSFW